MNGRNRTERSEAREEPIRLAYRPPAEYGLKLELFRMSELRRRDEADTLRRAQRIEFCLLMAITRGRCNHWVDFVPAPCSPGTWVLVRNGETQRFDPGSEWDAWIVLFEPDFLRPVLPSEGKGQALEGPRLDELPGHMRLDPISHRMALDGLARMRRDSLQPWTAVERHALLRCQLAEVLTRLAIADRQKSPRTPLRGSHAARFERFRDAVAQDFTRVQRVAEYAQRLGYSERSLNRLSMAMAGVTAKQYIAQRIVLEAKRLLVHTDLPVAVVAERLGMEEASNFVKFFRREAGCTPGRFRRDQGETG